MLLADWCGRIIGRDPAVCIRGRYASTSEAMALVGVKSLPMLFARLCRAAGLRLTTQPAYGDICIIELGGVVRGAIRTRGYVVIGEGAGISRVVRARLVAAWSVHG